MRVSTGMIYDAGRTSVQNKTSDLLRVQQQLATGRRILAPSDDPVAAAHALEVTQAASLNKQFANNQGETADILGLSEGNLQGLQNLYQRVHELTVQLGNTGALTDVDRKSIAAELRQRFDELLSVANETDGLGAYLYSGFKGDVKPFTGTPELGVTYNGDDGQRFQRVSASSLVAVSDSGNELFMKVKDDANPFAVGTGEKNRGAGVIGDPVVTDLLKWNSNLNGKNFSIKFAVNQTTAVTTYDIVDDTGKSVLTNSAATTSAPLPGVYGITQGTVTGSVVLGGATAITAGVNDVLNLTVDGVVASVTLAANAGYTNAALATEIQTKINANVAITAAGKSVTATINAAGNLVLTSNTLGASSSVIVTGGSSTATVIGIPTTVAGTSLQSGLPIPIKASVAGGQDFGATFTITGSPADGDTFTIRASAPKSIFKTLSELITIAETPVNAAAGTAGNIALAKGISVALSNIQAAEQSVSRVQTSIGARMNVIDSLSAQNSDRDIAYRETLSNLQDVDYTAAITDMNKQQVTLQAAQKSYVDIAKLSLFNYL